MSLTSTLQAIADAIRAKTGKTATMTPAEMPSEIAGIETGRGGIIVDDVRGLFRFYVDAAHDYSIRKNTLDWWDVNVSEDGELPGVDKDSGRPKVSVASGKKYDLAYAIAYTEPADTSGVHDVTWTVPQHGTLDHFADSNSRIKSAKLGTTVRREDGWPIGSGGSAAHAFDGATNLEEVDLDGVVINSYGSYLFSNCSKLRRVTGLLYYTNYHTVFRNAFEGCSSLEEITFDPLQAAYPMYGMSPLDLSQTSLSVSGAVALFASLPDVTGQSGYSNYCTITITGTPAASGLTAEQIAVATDKGWTVTT